MYKGAPEKRTCLAAQNEAAEVKLLAERKGGELLAGMELQDGARGVGKKVELHDATPPTLADLGVEKTQSHRWQLIASLPEDAFLQHIAETKGAGRELTSAAVLKLAKKMQAEAKPRRLACHCADDSPEDSENKDAGVNDQHNQHEDADKFPERFL